MKNEAGRHKPKRESLSFDALTEEMGDIFIPLPPDAVSGASGMAEIETLYGGTVIVDDEPSRALPDKGELPFRVLTGGSPRPMALWLQGALASGLALMFLLLPLFASEMNSYQPGISYVVIVLAGGACLWSLYGLRREKTPSGKRHCWAAAAFAFMVVVLAYWIRMPWTG